MPNIQHELTGKGPGFRQYDTQGYGCPWPDVGY